MPFYSFPASVVFCFSIEFLVFVRASAGHLDERVRKRHNFCPGRKERVLRRMALSCQHQATHFFVEVASPGKPDQLGFCYADKKLVPFSNIIIVSSHRIPVQAAMSSTPPIKYSLSSSTRNGETLARSGKTLSAASFSANRPR